MRLGSAMRRACLMCAMGHTSSNYMTTALLITRSALISYEMVNLFQNRATWLYNFLECNSRHSYAMTFCTALCLYTQSVELREQLASGKLAPVSYWF